MPKNVGLGNGAATMYTNNSNELPSHRAKRKRLVIKIHAVLRMDTCGVRLF